MSDRFVEIQEFRHEGATKNYHFALFIDPRGECIMVRRWGRVWTQGQAKVERFPNDYELRIALDVEKTKRAKKGYEKVGQVSVDSMESFVHVRRTNDVKDTVWLGLRPVTGLVNEWFGEAGANLEPAPSFDPEIDEVNRGELWGSW